MSFRFSFGRSRTAESLNPQIARQAPPRWRGLLVWREFRLRATPPIPATQNFNDPKVGVYPVEHLLVPGYDVTANGRTLANTGMTFGKERQAFALADNQFSQPDGGAYIRFRYRPDDAFQILQKRIQKNYLVVH